MAMLDGSARLHGAQSDRESITLTIRVHGKAALVQIEDRVALTDHPIDPLLGAGLAARRGRRRPRLQIPLVEVSRGVERSGRRQEDLEAKARGLAG